MRSNGLTVSAFAWFIRAVERWRRARDAAARGAAVGLVGVLTAGALTACGSSDSSASVGASPSPSAATGPVQLLDAESRTLLGQRFKYPQKRRPEVSSSIVVLEPGQESGWHRHKVPTYTYVLEGAVTMEFDNAEVRELPAGSAFIESIGTWHNVTNKGSTPARLLMVFMGADGTVSTQQRPATS